MALAGKAAGKDVGMWFGPSAAAGALRTLVDAFPACGLGVSVATDGTLFQTEVFAASHSPFSASSSAVSVSSSSSHGHGHGRGSSSGHSKPKESKCWGDRPVLLLLGIRLGLDGVNPIYYETIKLLYTFPQSVGIAGGRPSSSYYFVGVQGDGLFYLDPHHSRPAVPLKPFMGERPPAPSIPRSPSSSSHGHASSSSSHGHGHGHASSSSHGLHDRRSLSPEAAYARGGSTSPESAGYARAGSLSPELVYAPARGGSMSPDFAQGHGHGHGHTPMTEDELFVRPRESTAGPAPAGGHLTPAEEAYYARAYSAAELRTFHCERVRKMPMSGLDPSMLIGFLVRSEEEWVDLRRRVKELPRTIFAIQDEPPTWPGADDDDDMGLESVSDPEEAEDTGFDDGDVSSTSHAPSSNASYGVSTASHGAASSTFSHTHAHHNSNSTTNSSSTASSSARSDEVDTEEDPVAPITPLPGSRFDLSGAPPPVPAGKGKGTVGDAYAELEGEGDVDDFVDAAGDMDIEDDWVDPVAPSPPPPVSKKPSKGKGKGKSSRKAVPVPSVHYPFPVSVEDGGNGGSGAGVPASPPQRERDRERERLVTVSPRAAGVGAGGGGQRMHTARARDGGRTQSGGVRGILTEDQ
ncbi:peptidase family C54-domain-containing protein [Mycena capillaripes]|nr:peptidase family C54-domain-containing protein [Mycena capillaripes]